MKELINWWKLWKGENNNKIDRKFCIFVIKFLFIINKMNKNKFIFEDIKKMYNSFEIK